MNHTQSLLAAIVVSFSATVTAAPGVPIPSGALGWWSGDGNVSDQLGVHPGTYFGANAYATGRFGLAFSLDGSSSTVQIGLPVSNLKQMSFVAWFKSTDSEAMIFSARDSDSESQAVDGYATDVKLSTGTTVPGALDFYVNDYSTRTYPRSVGFASLNDGNWHHIATTFNNTGGNRLNDLRLYVDGAEVAKTDFSFNPYSSNTAISFSTLNIGRSGRIDPAESYFFTGLIDEASIYGRTLSLEEIQTLYAAQVPEPGPGALLLVGLVAVLIRSKKVDEVGKGPRTGDA